MLVTRLLPLLFASLLWAPSALAWDSAELWHAPADGRVPGGGGVVGTGSKTDFRIECLHCHIEPKQNIGLTFAPFDTAGDIVYYEPGAQYEIQVNLVGESLGKPESECPPNGVNVNLFAATFENTQGQSVGILESDTGQRQGTNCPANAPEKGSITTGSTLLYRDCRTIFVRDLMPEGTTQWQFRWTAPAAGTGDVILYAGGVDGNCDMMSMGDDVKMVKLTLTEGSQRASVFSAPARRQRNPGGALSPLLLDTARAQPSATGWWGVLFAMGAVLLAALGTRIRRA